MKVSFSFVLGHFFFIPKIFIVQCCHISTGVAKFSLLEQIMANGSHLLQHSYKVIRSIYKFSMKHHEIKLIDSGGGSIKNYKLHARSISSTKFSELGKKIRWQFSSTLPISLRFSYKLKLRIHLHFYAFLTNLYM